MVFVVSPELKLDEPRRRAVLAVLAEALVGLFEDSAATIPVFAAERQLSAVRLLLEWLLVLVPAGSEWPEEYMMVLQCLRQVVRLIAS